MNAVRTEMDLDHLSQGAAAWAVVSSWSGCGIFEALSDGQPHTAEALPGDTRAIRITAPIIAHLGLVMRVGEGWALTGTGLRLWGSGALQGLAGAEHQLGNFSRMDAVIKEGGPVKGPDGEPLLTEGGVRESEPQEARRFMNMLYRRSVTDAEELTRWVAPRLPRGARILDVGGGHGRYAFSLAQALDAQVTLFDRPVCLEIAEERFESQMNYQAGNFLVDELGGPWDGVLLSNIVHGLGPEENLDLLRRIKKSLAFGGSVIIKDMFIADNWTSPANAVLFGLTMLMYTREGQTYRETDFEALCQQAGFERFESHHLSDRGHSILIAG